MDRGLDQLLLFALVLIAGIFDLLMRWARRRRGTPSEAEGEGEIVVAESDSGEYLEVRRIEPPPSPPVSRPGPMPSKPAPPRPGRPVAKRAQRPARERRHQWLRNQSDARRAIVLMEILGPCRGLERFDHGRRDIG